MTGSPAGLLEQLPTRALGHWMKLVYRSGVGLKVTPGPERVYKIHAGHRWSNAATDLMDLMDSGTLGCLEIRHQMWE
jgi:hypothetical protein